MRWDIRFLTISVASALFLSGPAQAQRPIVYPAKGQNAQQQQQDENACYGWAKQSTGIDPAVVASAPPPPFLLEGPLR